MIPSTCSEKDIPGVPMEIPSETPIVLNRSPIIDSCKSRTVSCQFRTTTVCVDPKEHHIPRPKILNQRPNHDENLGYKDCACSGQVKVEKRTRAT